MIRNVIYGTIILIGLSVTNASAAVYASFSDGYRVGFLHGEDRNGDLNITGDELFRFQMVLDNRNGGTGQYYATLDSVTNFLFEFVTPGMGHLSGLGSFSYRQVVCGNGWYPPCEPGQPSWHENWFSESFRIENVAISAAPVPLPGGLPLLAGALMAGGLLRRLRRA